MDQALAYLQIYTIVRPRDGVGVHSTLPKRMSLPCLIVYDVPEVKVKKKTPILATFRDFCLSVLRRMYFPGSANPKSYSKLAHGVTLVRKPRFTAELYTGRQVVEVFKNVGLKLPHYHYTDGTRKLFFSFVFDSPAPIVTL